MGTRRITNTNAPNINACRTLSGTTKWSMQNQTLADRVAAFRGEG
jgi:hypothetical protein